MRACIITLLNEGGNLMKRISKILVVLASMALITGCRKNNGGGGNSGTTDKPTKEQLVEVSKTMAALKNYTIKTDMSMVDKDVDDVPFFSGIEIPMKKTYGITSNEEVKEGAKKQVSGQNKYVIEVDLEEARQYLNEELDLEQDLTMEDMINEAKKYKAKKNETYQVNEQTGTVTYEMKFDATNFSESYAIYDEEAKQEYSIYKDDNGYHFNNYKYETDSNDDDSILGLFSLGEIIENGTMNSNSGVLSYTTKADDGEDINAELRFSIVNNYLDKMNVVASTSQARIEITVQYSKIGSTSFETPKVVPLCDYDHNINHTPSRWIQTKAGHRLACQQCYRYLSDTMEPHDHSHNDLGICEKCGYQIGLNKENVDLGNETVNEILKLRTSSETEKLIYYSESYDYDTSTSDYNMGTSTNWRYYAEYNAISYSTSSQSDLSDNSCVRVYNYTHQIFTNISTELATAASERNWTVVKETLPTLTPTYSGESFRYSTFQHNNKADADCEKAQITPCREDTYVVCADCGQVTQVKSSVNHNYEHVEQHDTVINSCVTKHERICNDCHEIVSTEYTENHEHMHDVFATKAELATYGIDASEYEPQYDNPIFYFTYCDDCHQIGNSYGYDTYLYEIDADYRQKGSHTSYGTKAYEIRLKIDEETGKYVLNNPSYPYESNYHSVPHKWVDGECELCGTKIYTFPDPLITIEAVMTEENGLDWYYAYYESEDSTYQYSGYRPWSSNPIEDHVLVYNNVMIRGTYYAFKEYYNEDDTKVIKVEVYNQDLTELLLTVQ